MSEVASRPGGRSSWSEEVRGAPMSMNVAKWEEGFLSSSCAASLGLDPSA